MPFVIRPPLDSSAADDPSRIFTILEPEPYERLILHDLRAWDWRITRHGFGDYDFIDALKQIEKDIKKRRRQTHAIGGELYGYNARPTLEQVWELEAERMLNEEAYQEPQESRRNAIVENDDDEIRSHEAEKTWLRSIDHTRQTNDHLEYNDPDGEYPRLVTRGLDHTYTCEITATNHKRPSHYHRAISRISKSKTFAKHIIHQRAKDFHDMLPSFSQLVLEQNQALHNPAYIPFIFEFPTRHFETTKSPQPQCNTTLIPTTNTTQETNTRPYLHPSRSAASLIFPHTQLSKRQYVHQTRRGIKRSKSCPPRPRNEDEDPYGWLEWDRRRVKKIEADVQKRDRKSQMEELKAHWRWFVRREGRTLGSLERGREGG